MPKGAETDVANQSVRKQEKRSAPSGPSPGLCPVRPGPRLYPELRFQSYVYRRMPQLDSNRWKHSNLQTLVTGDEAATFKHSQPSTPGIF